ncbi:hypothetical protein POVWA2_053030 [Plasmodium ovale wallikeri]|uniref:Uncharacterized protein n=1 Tax=Plasmodium ovale wallikeri TaxID=864142 RepID=A0A1A8ZT05_PLAOA|nr:hypothetical protein POVWA2_053030 [Plasmodium ovale wallikeri]
MEVQQTGKAEVRREGEEEKDEKNEVKLEKRLWAVTRFEKKKKKKKKGSVKNGKHQIGDASKKGMREKGKNMANVS